MFEITGDDIAKLSDSDLRALIGRLCEVAARRRELPTSSVTWGGSQEAPDGGLDVRVELPANVEIDGFIPRSLTGFQVKKSNMTPASILREMRPKGVVRPVLKELAEKSGAYIIVSSGSSASDSALAERCKAMFDAIRRLKNSADLKLDFYDQGRIATWVRDHPGLIPWIRARIGNSIRGWQSYGPWAFPTEDDQFEYLLDDRARAYVGRKSEAKGLTVLEGIQYIRDVLQKPRHVVRLVGLSGVGKTRLTQALFDERVGEHSLEPSLAIYADLADDP